MFTALDFDSFKIPVPKEWKQRLAHQIAIAAETREKSYSLTKGKWGGYAITISDAVIARCDGDMIEIVNRCLIGSWNESIDFAKRYGENC